MIIKLTSKPLAFLFTVLATTYITSCGKENPVRPNHPPVANAGPDQTIVLPLSTVVLNGEGSSDLDNNIASYQWTKTSGPSSFIISIPVNYKKWQGQVTNLVEGNYQFELKVTDAVGLVSKDTVQVMVIASPPSNPYQIFYFSGLKWEVSPFDNGVMLIVPGVPNRNASEVTGVATTDQADCNGNPWGVCYLNDFQSLQKDGTQAGVIYYRIENASVVLYIKSQPFNSYYQSAQYAVLIEFG